MNEVDSRHFGLCADAVAIHWEPDLLGPIAGVVKVVTPRQGIAISNRGIVICHHDSAAHAGISKNCVDTRFGGGPNSFQQLLIVRREGPLSGLVELQCEARRTGLGRFRHIAIGPTHNHRNGQTLKWVLAQHPAARFSVSNGKPVEAPSKLPNGSIRDCGDLGSSRRTCANGERRRRRGTNHSCDDDETQIRFKVHGFGTKLPTVLIARPDPSLVNPKTM